MFVDYNDFNEMKYYNFFADASELGITPLRYSRLGNEKFPTNLGNKNELYLESLTSDKAVLKQPAGCITVTIYND